MSALSLEGNNQISDGGSPTLLAKVINLSVQVRLHRYRKTPLGTCGLPYRVTGHNYELPLRGFQEPSFVISYRESRSEPTPLA